MSSTHWHVGSKHLPIGQNTWLMGIVNVTPDSFSDGGSYLDPAQAVQHGMDLASQGADLLDIGGESTRPGSAPVSAKEEANRVVPVIKGLRKELPDILLSIDTTKASVAHLAVEAGVDIVNDVSAGTQDPEMFNLVASSDVGYILMHMQGTPQSMQQNPAYRDVVSEVISFLQDRLNKAIAAGIAKDRLAIDPGIGFGKTLEHNLALLSELSAFTQLGHPLLLGVSRKRWIGELTGQSVEHRLAGSLAGAAACIERGAHLLRVHDVAETKDLIRVLDRIRHGETSEDCN